MSNQLLDIHPRELTFVFELKKQSSCSVRVFNKTDYLVAYKVKTTSPKKYCVRPNVGVLKPKQSCDFTVTMQGQKAAPPDLICKDKFLVQSAIVPDGTTDEDITSSMFVKDDFRRVEDNKLKVILVSPSHSPELSPKKEASGHMPAHEAIFLEDHIVNDIEITSSQPKKKNLEDINLHKSHIIEEIISPIQTNRGGFDVNEDVAIQNYARSVDINVPQKEVIDDIGLQKHRDREDINTWKNDSIESISMQKDKTIKETTSLTKHDLASDCEAPILDLKGHQRPLPFHPLDIEDKGLQKHWTSEDNGEGNNDSTGDINVQKEPTIAGVIPPTKHKIENIIPVNKAVNTSRESVVKNSVGGAVAAELGMKKDENGIELVKDIEIMKSKLNGLESKLREAEITITKLNVERIVSSEERESLRKEVVASKSRTIVRKNVQVGFPFLYVVVVAFVSMVLGYRFHC